MQKTVRERAYGGGASRASSSSSSSSRNSRYSRLCIIGNTISILRQMHGGSYGRGGTYPLQNEQHKGDLCLRKKEREKYQEATVVFVVARCTLYVVRCTLYVVERFGSLVARTTQPQNHPVNPPLRPDLRAQEIQEATHGRLCLQLLLTVLQTLRIYRQPCETISDRWNRDRLKLP